MISNFFEKIFWTVNSSQGLTLAIVRDAGAKPVSSSDVYIVNFIALFGTIWYM